MRASAFTLSLLCALPLHAESTKYDLLRARSNEQERQIRTLESEIEALHDKLALERRRSRVTSPVSSSVSRPESPDVKTYVVTTGDTLSSIARAHHSSVAKLMKANNIEDPTRLRAGQQIALPSDAVISSPTPFFKKTPPRAVPVAEEKTTLPAKLNYDHTQPIEQGVTKYKIQRGDTLYGIARRYGLSIEQLRILNPDVEDRILVGQEIALQHQATRRSQEERLSVIPATVKKRTPSPRTITYKPVQTNVRPTKKTPTKEPKKTLKKATAPSKNKISTVELNSSKTKSVEAPTRISSIFVSEEVTFADFARRHGTTPEELNALNGWDFRGSLLLAKGSEIYVPGS